MQRIMIIFAALIIMGLTCCYDNSNKKPLQTWPDEVETVNQFIVDTVHDTVPVVVQKVVYKTPGQVKRQMSEYARIIEELGGRIKDLEYIQTTSVRISDSVKASYKDSIFSYNDEFINLKLNIVDTIFNYSCKDSLTASIAPLYKHKFLWWRWGIKGYNMTLVPSNPHATIKYNQFIKVQK